MHLLQIRRNFRDQDGDKVEREFSNFGERSWASCAALGQIILLVVDAMKTVAAKISENPLNYLIYGPTIVKRNATTCRHPVE